MTKYLSFAELSRDQIIELKRRYLIHLEEEGTLNEVLYNDPNDESPLTAEELANADSIVPDSAVESQRDGVMWTADDFFCSSVKEVI